MYSQKREENPHAEGEESEEEAAEDDEDAEEAEEGLEAGEEEELVNEIEQRFEEYKQKEKAYENDHEECDKEVELKNAPGIANVADTEDSYRDGFDNDSVEVVQESLKNLELAKKSAKSLK